MVPFPSTPDAQSLIEAGFQARRDNRLPEARAAFTEAVNLGRDNDSQAPHLPQALKGLGQVERDLGDIPAALQHYREAADLYRSPVQPLVLAHTLRHIGDILRENGDTAPAAVNYDEALLLYRDHPAANPLDLANTLRGYALLKAATGHPEIAVAYWQEARALYDSAQVQAGVEEANLQIAALSPQP